MTDSIIVNIITFMAGFFLGYLTRSFKERDEKTLRSVDDATATNQNSGGGGAHNNLQPYIVVYRYRRTA